MRVMPFLVATSSLVALIGCEPAAKTTQIEKPEDLVVGLSARFSETGTVIGEIHLRNEGAKSICYSSGNSMHIFYPDGSYVEYKRENQVIVFEHQVSNYPFSRISPGETVTDTEMIDLADLDIDAERARGGAFSVYWTSIALYDCEKIRRGVTVLKAGSFGRFPTEYLGFFTSPKVEINIPM